MGCCLLWQYRQTVFYDPTIRDFKTFERCNKRYRTLVKKKIFKKRHWEKFRNNIIDMKSSIFFKFFRHEMYRTIVSVQG